MIKIENVETFGWKHAIRGMRNPMDSWEKSDSECLYHMLPNWPEGEDPELDKKYNNLLDQDVNLKIGPNDHDLMMRLRNAGTDHRKFMRMIVVYMDITAPLYWWKEFSTYKVGTVANSCSTMHKIADKEFTLKDFSCEYLVEENINELKSVIKKINKFRDKYINWKDSDVYIDNDSQIVDKKVIWWQMIQLLPSSYNQKRTVMLNYEVLANMYKSRKNHKLDEWVDFCKWIESLPYSELITGDGNGHENPIRTKQVI